MTGIIRTFLLTCRKNAFFAIKLIFYDDTPYNQRLWSDFISQSVFQYEEQQEEGAYLELVGKVRPPLPKLEEYILSDVGRESLVIALVIACKDSNNHSVPISRILLQRRIEVDRP